MEVFSFPSVHEMSGFWDMGQNASGQSNCRILKLFVPVELIEEIPGVLVRSYKLIKLKVLSRLEQIWAWPPWSQVSEAGCIWRMNRWNKLIFACWYKSREAKSHFSSFGWVWSLRSSYFKIGSMSRMDKRNQLIICKLKVI